MSIDARRLAAYYDQSVPPSVLVPPVAPTLTTLAPSSIVIDTPTPVTITGTDFRPDSHVYVDGVRQSSSFVNATTMTYLAQADTVGTQDVRVATAGLVSEAQVLTVTATAVQEMSAPEQRVTTANTKADIIAWLVEHDDTLDADTLNEHTKSELLDMVAEVS